jgi:hypothetical protein
MFDYNIFVITETCPPLLSDSLNIKCTLNGTYANCSNPSIPNTIAMQSCKQTQIILNGQEETPIELRCQSNGTWNNDLYRCTSCNCIFTLYKHKCLIYIYD